MIQQLPQWLLSLVEYDPSGCWFQKSIYKAKPKSKKNPYPMIRYNGEPRRTYQVVYELYYGRPCTRDIHHTCEIKRCINPEHLEKLSRSAHKLRHQKDVCDRGHPLVEPNLIPRKDGRRRCKICYERGQRHYNEERRAKSRCRESSNVTLSLDTSKI